MQNLSFWFRPTLFLFAWILITAFTLAELATMAPVFTSLGAEPVEAREVGGVRPVRARTQVLSRRMLAP
jgi:hypothetical protein